MGGGEEVWGDATVQPNMARKRCCGHKASEEWTGGGGGV